MTRATTVTLKALAALTILAGCASLPIVGVEIDQSERIIWTATEADASRLCWERYDKAGAIACYNWDEDVIVLSRTAPPSILAHERCHRLGWPKTHPWPPPAACELK